MTYKVASRIVAVVLLSIGAVAHATTVGVISRAALGGNDYVDWAAAGPDFTVHNAPFGMTSNGGISMTVSNGNGFIEARTQGSSWGGNFAFGDALLWTQTGSVGPIITENFSTPVQGVGAQMQSDYYGSFAGSIEAFDSSNNSLGSFSRGDGLSSGAGNNSAIFVGILSSSANISRVQFTMANNSTTGSADFAINRMDLVTATAVPLPPAVWAGGVLLAAVGFHNSRRRVSAA